MKKRTCSFGALSKRFSKPLALIIWIALAATLAALPADAAISRDTLKTLEELNGALAGVAETVKPSVVNVSTTSTVSVQKSPFGDLFNDPMFRRFFGDQFEHPGLRKKYKTSALGSGVIVSSDGYILTNNHVVKDAEEIKVILYDKREFTGKVIGSDSRTDLAVIKIKAKDLPVLPFADSAGLKSGDIVLAVGNPFGLNQTITLGIVSAVGRSNIGLADFEDFIQTDAAINPGNSGGALVDIQGRLVGINTAIFSTSGGYMGIGFAIPSDMARSVMDSIIKHGKVIRGWLGVSIQSLTPELAKQFKLKEEHGALVSDVMKGSPAEKAGLKRGDLIIDFDGKAVEDPAHLRNLVAQKAPGTKVRIKVIRDGKERSLSATLGEFKERKTEKAKVERENVLNGVSVQDITPDLRDKLDVPEDVSGVVVTGVAMDSAAAGAIGRGDVIVQINHRDIGNADEFENIASKIGKDEGVLLLVFRGGGFLYVTIRP